MCVRTSTHIYLEFSFSKKESHCNIWSNYKLVKEQRTKTTSLSCINVLCARIKKMPKFHAFLITSLYAKLFSGASSLIFSWLPFKKQIEQKKLADKIQIFQANFSLEYLKLEKMLWDTAGNNSNLMKPHNI